MDIEDIKIPEVPIPARILEEKRAAARRIKRSASTNAQGKRQRSNTNSSVKKAS